MDDETGWNHFELREYDPSIARWLGVDPRRQFLLPYVAMGSNPVTGDASSRRLIFGQSKYNMQLSEVFRIGIIVPLTESTKNQLESRNLENCVEVKILPLTQEEFYQIWDTGFFEEINNLLGVRIGEYEDECIDSLQSSLGVLHTYIVKYSSNELILGILKKVYTILMSANELKMPVYFIF